MTDRAPLSASRFPRYAAPLIMTVLGFVILLLILNLSEVDHYPGASREPPGEGADSASRPIGMTEAPRCACVCLDCRHDIEAAAGRMVFEATDRDGWYRLFWAGSTRYYFSDASSFLTALENETCVDPSGSWKLTVTYPSPCRGKRPVLFCHSEVPHRVTLEYSARLSETPPESIDFVADEKGMLRIPTRVIGPGREIVRTGKLVFIEWVLSKPPVVTYQKCACPE